MPGRRQRHRRRRDAGGVELDAALALTLAVARAAACGSLRRMPAWPAAGRPRSSGSGAHDADRRDRVRRTGRSSCWVSAAAWPAPAAGGVATGSGALRWLRKTRKLGSLAPSRPDRRVAADIGIERPPREIGADPLRAVQHRQRLRIGSPCSRRAPQAHGRRCRTRPIRHSGATGRARRRNPRRRAVCSPCRRPGATVAP